MQCHQYNHFGHFWLLFSSDKILKMAKNGLKNDQKYSKRGSLMALSMVGAINAAQKMARKMHFWLFFMPFWPDDSKWQVYQF